MQSIHKSSSLLLPYGHSTSAPLSHLFQRMPYFLNWSCVGFQQTAALQAVLQLYSVPWGPTFRNGFSTGFLWVITPQGFLLLCELFSTGCSFGLGPACAGTPWTVASFRPHSRLHMEICSMWYSWTAGTRHSTLLLSSCTDLAVAWCCRVVSHSFSLLSLRRCGTAVFSSLNLFTERHSKHYLFSSGQQ